MLSVWNWLRNVITYVDRFLSLHVCHCCLSNFSKKKGYKPRNIIYKELGLFASFLLFLIRYLCHVNQQTVKRPRKVPVNLLNRPPSPDDRVFNNDYNDDYNYDQDRRSVYSGRSGGGRDHSLERERGGGGYMDSGYHTRERDYDRDYDRRERGRSAERDLSPDRQYRRDGSRGRTLDKERSPERPYRGDHTLGRDFSPDRRYRSERALDRDHSPDRRYRSERALDREYSPDRRYRSERTLDRTNSPDLRTRRDSHSPARGRRDHSFERGRDRIPSDPRKYEEPLKRSGSRDRLDRSPSPAAMPIPLPRPVRDLEPLEKPLNVLLLKNRPNEGEKPANILPVSIVELSDFILINKLYTWNFQNLKWPKIQN